MPTAVSVTRLFSAAVDGHIFSGANSSIPLQPAAGPLILPDDASEWAELASPTGSDGYYSAELVSGGLTPEGASFDVDDGKFRLTLFLSRDTAGLIPTLTADYQPGYMFPAGTIMQLGLVAPPGTDLVFYPSLDDPTPVAWWDTDGYWGLDSRNWGVLGTSARIFIVITTSTYEPPSEFWTNFIGSSEII